MKKIPPPLSPTSVTLHFLWPPYFQQKTPFYFSFKYSQLTHTNPSFLLYPSISPLLCRYFWLFIFNFCSYALVWVRLSSSFGLRFERCPVQIHSCDIYHLLNSKKKKNFPQKLGTRQIAAVSPPKIVCRGGASYIQPVWGVLQFARTDSRSDSMINKPEFLKQSVFTNENCWWQFGCLLFGNTLRGRVVGWCKEGCVHNVLTTTMPVTIFLPRPFSLVSPRSPLSLFRPNIRELLTLCFPSRMGNEAFFLTAEVVVTYWERRDRTIAIMWNVQLNWNHQAK
jgi:hypothetical protein